MVFQPLFYYVPQWLRAAYFWSLDQILSCLCMLGIIALILLGPFLLPLPCGTLLEVWTDCPLYPTSYFFFVEYRLSISNLEIRNAPNFRFQILVLGRLSHWTLCKYSKNQKNFKICNTSGPKHFEVRGYSVCTFPATLSVPSGFLSHGNWILVWFQSLWLMISNSFFIWPTRAALNGTSGALL